MTPSGPGSHLATLRVNGEAHEVVLRATDTLDRVLREQLGLTGTKVGCELGECGACTVLVDGAPTLSCLTLALEVVGATIRTIEGVAGPDGLHPLQQAFLDHGAAQCGYCTPGMIMSGLALLQRQPTPDAAAVREALVGNLCRCTGYVKIVDAVVDAGQRLAPAGEGRDA